MSRVGLRILAAGFAFAPFATAQDDGPPAPPSVVLAVGAEDGLPRPGVEVLVTPHRQFCRSTPDGLVIVEPREIARFKASWRGRTDPEGRVAIPANLAREILMGDATFTPTGPYRCNDRVERAGDHWVMKVTQIEPIGLLAVDAAGTRLPEFPLALYGDGRVMCYGLTDREGRELLAFQPGYTARVVVAPAGWIGSLDAFPTLAAGLAGRRGTTLTVPAHGTVRVRFQRGGAPIQTSINMIRLDFEDEQTVAPEFLQVPATECSGFELPLVALGTPFALSSTTSDRWEVRVAPLREDGQIAEYIVDLGPEVTFRIAGNGLAKHVRIRLRLVTDTSALELCDYGWPEVGLRVPCHRALPGTRLVRVEVDAQPMDDLPSPAWTHGTARDVAIPLPTAELRLGDLVLEAQPPPLRGRVLDRVGNPVPDANVEIAREGIERRDIVTTAKDGTFVLCLPPVRDAHGNRVGSRAIARLGDSSSAESELVPFGGEVVLHLDPAMTREPTVSAREPDSGSMRVVLRAVDCAVLGERRLSLVATSGWRRYEAAIPASADRAEVRFEGVAKGTYSLVAQHRDYGPFVVLDDLECDGLTPCADARLQQPIEFDTRLRVTTLVVVDSAHIPIAGARVSWTNGSRGTDGTGTAHILWNRESKSAITIEHSGMRPVRLAEPGDRHEIVLEPASVMAVAVTGLPADIARDHLFVWVRGAARGSFEGNQAKLDDDGTARVELPVPGNYRAILLVKIRTGNRGWSGTSIAQTEPFVIGNEAPDSPTITLDEAAIARLREALEKAKDAPR